MNTKYRDYLFFTIIFFLIFNCIPKPIQLNFLGGMLGNKLFVYPLIIGFIYSFYIHLKVHEIFVDGKLFLKYIAIYILVTFFSLALGLYFFPYYDQILNGPITQIAKLYKLAQMLKEYNIFIDIKSLTIPWMVINIIRRFILEIIYSFGGAYLFYCWYKNDYKRGIDIIVRGILASTFIICFYCIIELMYLSHINEATKILETINPYIHEIKKDGSWWPPLLWRNQLRSVFAEPSHFGIYVAFILPFLWYKIADKWENKKVLSFYTFITFIITFLLFLTKARTAVAVHIGELSILILLLLYLRKFNLWKKCILIFICSIMAFAVSSYFISSYMNFSNNVVNNKSITNAIDKKLITKQSSNQKDKRQTELRYEDNSGSKKSTKQNKELQKTIDNYINDNLLSLTNLEKRSNGARYSIMMSDIKIGLDNPIWGIGRGLRNSYIPDYLPQKAFEIQEVKMWFKFRESLGLLRYSFPELGEYTSRFSETGFVGLFLFLFPPGILFCKLLNKLKKNDEILIYMFYIIVLLGTMASVIGDSLYNFYQYWIILGIGYCVCFSNNNQTQQ